MEENYKRTNRTTDVSPATPNLIKAVCRSI